MNKKGDVEITSMRRTKKGYKTSTATHVDLNSK